jgi:DNA-binding transcriptional LysR family regulator
LADDVNVELLFDDRLVVAAGINNRFARRRKIDLAVVDEPWILAPPGTWHHARVQEAFKRKGLACQRGA